MRYHVVVVSKYIGIYNRPDLIAWAIADHDRANRVIGRNYDTQEEAQREADLLNTQEASLHRD